MSGVLVISPEPWSGHFVSKHHYAIELACLGHRVFFLGPPEAEGALKLEQVQRGDTKLTVVHSPPVARGLRVLPAVVRQGLERRWLAYLEREAGCAIDVVWLFENSRFYDMRFAQHRLKIYHQVDLNQDFHPRIASRTADHVFCTSKAIRKTLREFRSEVTVIQHGTPLPSSMPELRSSPFDPDRLNAAYVGNLSIPYIDWPAVQEIMEAHPGIAFHFFGGSRRGDPNVQDLGRHANVRLHGAIDPACIVPLLRRADVLLLLYDTRYLDQVSNPHKMIEYMISGTPIIASHTLEYRGQHDLIDMGGIGQPLGEHFARSLDRLDRFGSQKLVDQRIAFAMDNTYSRQIERIRESMGPHGSLLR